MKRFILIENLNQPWATAGPKSRFWGKFLFLTDPDWTPGPPQGGSNPPLSSSDLGQILLSLNPVKGRLQN